MRGSRWNFASTSWHQFRNLEWAAKDDAFKAVYIEQGRAEATAARRHREALKRSRQQERKRARLVARSGEQIAAVAPAPVKAPAASASIPSSDCVLDLLVLDRPLPVTRDGMLQHFANPTRRSEVAYPISAARFAEFYSQGRRQRDAARHFGSSAFHIGFGLECSSRMNYVWYLLLRTFALCV